MFLGIDPGKSGGVALVTPNRNAVFAVKMPATEEGIARLFEEVAVEHRPTSCYLEFVHAMPGQGVTSMFNFGQNFGAIKAALYAARIEFNIVSPVKWQKTVGLIFPKLTKTEKKNRHKARAADLFPELKITHAIADALLIAEYTRMVSE